MSGLSHSHDCLFNSEGYLRRTLTAQEQANHMQKEGKRELARLETHIWRLSKILGERYYIIALVNDLANRKAFHRALQRPLARKLFGDNLDLTDEVAYRNPYFSRPNIAIGGLEEFTKSAYIVQENWIQKDCISFNEMLVLDLGGGEARRKLSRKRSEGLRWHEHRFAIYKEGIENTTYRFAFRGGFCLDRFVSGCDCSGQWIITFPSFFMHLHYIEARGFVRADRLSEIFPHLNGVASPTDSAEPRWQFIFRGGKDMLCMCCGERLARLDCPDAWRLE